MTSTQEADELRSTVRRFLEQRSTEADVRRLMDDPAGYDPAVWSQMSDQLGLQGLAIPEEFGGSGYSYAELGIVFEEMGRALLSGPFFASIALAANALLESGDDGAKKEYLPGIASGETIATLAISEEHGGWDQDAIALTATGSGATWNLTGTKRYVPDAHIANLLIVAARSGDGVSLFAVDPAAAGVNVEVELTMDQTRKLARITFDNTPARLIGTAGEAWDGLRRALRLAAIALACEQVGGAQHMLDLTVEYAKQRYQFGRPIGSFQAIKHKIADMLVDVESAKSAAYAARRAAADSSDDLERAASVAKAFCSEAYYRTAAEAIQLHGGIGFTWEHQAHLYFKRAKSSEFFLGSPGFHREQIGLAIGV